MSTPYQRGAAFEHRVKAELEGEGYLVIRSPASKSAFDLVGLPAASKGARLPVLVQCKLRGVIAGSESDHLVEVAVIFGALPVMAYTLRAGGAVHFVLPRKGVPKARWVSWSP